MPPRTLATAFHGIPIFATLSSLATGLGGQVILIFSGAILARSLGVSGRGELAGLLIWPTVLALICCMGIPTAVSYFLSSTPAHAPPLLGVAYRIALVQAAATTLLLAGTLYFYTRNAGPAVRTAGLVVLAYGFLVVAQQYTVSFLQGLRRFTAFNICRICPALLTSMCLVFASFAHERRLAVFVSIYMLAILISVTIFNAWILLHAKLRWHNDSVDVPALIRFGTRGFLGDLSPVSTLPIDQAVVALFLSPTTLGIYVIANSFVNLPRFVAQSIAFISFPTVGAKARQEYNLAMQLVWRFFWLAVSINVAIGVVLFFAFPWIIPLVFGSAFARSVPIARILLIGGISVASRQILMEGLRGMGRPRTSTIAEVSMYPWLAFAAPLLTWRYGVSGLAFSLSGGYSISLVVAIMLTQYGPNESPHAAAAPLRFLKAAGPQAAPVFGLLMLCLLAAISTVWLPAYAVLGLCLAVAAMCVLLAVGRYAARRRTAALNARSVGGGLVAPAELSVEDEVHRAASPMPGVRVARVLYYGGTASMALLVFRPVAGLNLSDLLFVASLLMAVLASVVDKSQVHAVGVYLPQLFVGMLLFSAGVVLSSLTSRDPVSSASEGIKFVYLTGTWFWLGQTVLRNRGQLRLTVLLWAGSVAMSGGIAFLEEAFGFAVGGAAAGFGRVSGLAQHVNDLGGAATCVFPAVLVLAIGATNSRRSQVVYFTLLLLVSAALMLSGSVAGLVVVGVVSLAVVLIRGVRFRHVMYAAVALSCGLWLLSVQHSVGGRSPFDRFMATIDSSDPVHATAYTRWDLDKKAGDAIVGSPLIGVGLDASSSTLDGVDQAHNIFLKSWYEGGILEVSGMLIIVVSITVVGARLVAVRTGSLDWDLRLAVFMAWLGFVAFSQSAPILYQRYGWMSGALLLVMYALGKREEAGGVRTRGLPGSLLNVGITRRRSEAGAGAL